jgi:formate hydrogenlyase subunit 3/multisubunit Na+/H+ antiporter MnhD subunit
VSAVYVGTVAGASLIGCLALLVTPAHRRPLVAGTATGVVGAMGLALGVAMISGGMPPVHVGWLIPVSGITLAGDATSGWFVAVTGGVAVAVGIYTPGYCRRSPLPVAALAALPLFVAAMLLLPLAATVTSFLTLWELMALGSLVLVLSDHHQAETRHAALVYAAMTQLGFLAIVIALMLLAAGTGTETFAGLQVGAQHLSPELRAAIFLLSLIGFGSKSGLVPLHAWLARAHPEAPTPVSALLSAAMVNCGIYGIIRVDVTLLGPGPRWWGLLLVLLGGLTAVYAALHAMMATDLKRLLAFSTSENMGLIALGIGASMLLATYSSPVAQVAMAAALLQVATHAAFKTLGFLGAGSVLAGTGLRDLDRLGGLAPRMPVTALFFAIAALGAAGLPLGAGFAGEWLLLQGLIHTAPASDAMLALVLPLAVAAVALTAGLAVAAMVKAFGVGFLARPRSTEATQAREVPPSMLAGAGMAAGVCVVLGVAPVVLSPGLAAALRALPSTGHLPPPHLGTLLRLPGVAGSVSPSLLAIAFTAALALAVGVTGLRARRRPAQRQAALWNCGGPPLTSRMQYTASSYAQPIQRVFDDVLRPDIDVQVSHASESRYLIDKVSYRARILDGIEQRLYQPIIRGVVAAAELVRRAHTGSVHTYLAYGAAGLLVVLVLAR